MGTPAAPGGTIDLDWATLSPEMAEKIIALLNSHLASTTRPSFIGPISITSFDFGSSPPDVELIDVRDIYRDFLEDDQVSSSSSSLPLRAPLDEDGFEWVSRREGARGDAVEGNAKSPYNYLPPHIRYGAASAAADFTVGHPAFHPSRNGPVWEPQGLRMGIMGMSLPNLLDPRMHRTPTFRTPLDPGGAPMFPRPESSVSISSSPPPSPPQSRPDIQPSASAHPDVQFHFRILFESNLRLTLNTSLQINYPSPLLMALPVRLSVIGLVFQGELVVAYEGSRRRIHMCIVDDLDPYGPSASRTSPSSSQQLGGDGNDRDNNDTKEKKPPILRPLANSSPVGVRLLPSIIIESEIGQADKHVLKNVSRVERFIQDVIRKTLEEEFVFPNFHTLILGDDT
jgi:mitochondrial distribution and morphology protein 12